MNSLRATGITLIALVAGCFNPHYESPGFFCNTNETLNEGCPSGQVCMSSSATGVGQCIASASSGGASGGDNLSVAKTAAYTTPTASAMLDNESECPDSSLEPDDDFGQAVDLSKENIAVDGNPLKLQNLAICPTGPNPKANNHDVDLFALDVPSALTAVITITYDVQYGDLDIGVFDSSGATVASDGSSTSNGCVATPLSAGTYYIGVFGAKNQDVNRYSMSVRYSSSAATCGS